nr:unnamed protein product [Naegleria fowleri]
MTRNEGIASLVEDSVTLMAMMLVLIPVFIVYFKRHCYLLLGFLIRVTLLMGCCFCWGRSARTKLDDLIHEWKNNEKTKNREFFFVLLHTVIAFLLFRIPAEGATIAQHYYDLQQDYSTFVVVLQIRRIFDYTSIFWFTFNFTFIIPIWLKVCMVWVNRKKHQKLIIITMSTFLIVGNICLFFGLAPVTALSIAVLAKPDLTNDLEKLRKTFTTAIAIPLVGTSTAIVFFLSIGTVVIIVYMLRQKSKLVPDNSEQYQLQKQTMVKLTIGVVILAAGVLIEVLGVGLYGLDVATYIFYPFAKAIPYCSFTLCVALIFWPYHLPFLNNPIQFVMHEIKFSQKPERRRATVVENLNDDDDQIPQQLAGNGSSKIIKISSGSGREELPDDSMTKTTTTTTTQQKPSSTTTLMTPTNDQTIELITEESSPLNAQLDSATPTLSNVSGMQEMIPSTTSTTMMITTHHHSSCLSITTNDDSAPSTATPNV